MAGSGPLETSSLEHRDAMLGQDALESPDRPAIPGREPPEQLGGLEEQMGGAVPRHLPGPEVSSMIAAVAPHPKTLIVRRLHDHSGG